MVPCCPIRRRRENLWHLPNLIQDGDSTTLYFPFSFAPFHIRELFAIHVPTLRDDIFRTSNGYNRNQLCYVEIRMIIGVPKEVKDHESRVSVTPAGVKALVEAGHKVLVEQKASALSAMPDDEYQAAGAEIVGSAHDVWRLAEMVVKVKEPVEKEYKHFREGLVLFTFLHLASLPELTVALIEKHQMGEGWING